MKNRFGLGIVLLMVTTIPTVWADSSDILPPEVAHTQAKAKPGNPKASTVPLKPYLRLTTPRHTTVKPTYKVSTTLYPGSLKNNITRIAAYYGWKNVVWSAPDDYNWVGTTRVRAANLQGILRKVLKDFPLQAVFYEGNHVLVITPRTLR